MISELKSVAASRTVLPSGMLSYPHALLGTDFSASNDALIDALSPLHDLGVERITLVHVVPREGGKQCLTEVAQKLSRLGFETATRGESGVPAQGICDAADALAPDLLVLGSRGENAQARFLLGSTAMGVLYGTRVPLLIIRIDRPQEGRSAVRFGLDTFRRILLATDGSDEAAGAERTAQRLADHAERSVFLTVLAGRGTAGREEAHALLESLADEVAGRVTIRVEPGPVVWGVIRRVAREEQAELVIVGKRGRGAARERLIGSTADAVASRAGRSVLVVPDGVFVG